MEDQDRWVKRVKHMKKERKKESETGIERGRERYRVQRQKDIAPSLSPLKPHRQKERIYYFYLQSS